MLFFLIKLGLILVVLGLGMTLLGRYLKRRFPDDDPRP